MIKTVMIIDSQIVTRRMLRFAMELQGHRIVDVDDLSAALVELCKGDNIDLLIVGLNTPDDENCELIRRIRQQEALDNLPILVVGDKRLASCRAEMVIGNSTWLNRPFRISELHGVAECLFGNVPLNSPRKTMEPQG